MQVRETVAIDATVDRVWQVLADVEAWPSWTSTMRSVRLRDDPPPRAGSRVRIRQPGLPAGTWTVTRWEPGMGFEWERSSPGVLVRAQHLLAAEPDGPVVVTLTVEVSGPAGRLVSVLARRRTLRYVRTEAESLRRRVERPSAGPR